jgi:dipeptidyl aminopeptidase/acylaminoacyl peptidase
MKKWFFAALSGAMAFCCQAQTSTLTVEKIMRDPKWIGTSPSNVCWDYSGQKLLFNWNPDQKISDSAYEYHLQNGEIKKAAYLEAMRTRAIREGVYNQSRTRIAYTFRGNIYLLETSTGKTTRITETETEEAHPGFSNKDRWVTYISGNNLYAWDIESGSTRQLTLLISSEAPAETKPTQQEAWLDSQQLRTSEVLRNRVEKREAHKKYLTDLHQHDTLRKIYIGNKRLSDIQISPDARFISYTLTEENSSRKNTVVPNYVTETGFTTDIKARTKVGRPHNPTTSYLLDLTRDTLMHILTDSLPGLTDLPSFFHDYPSLAKKRAGQPKQVELIALEWNLEGSEAVADIRSIDQKDRWLVQLNLSGGSPKVLDHQHDEAWIGGPGIGGDPALGWSDNQHYYYQSEATGFSHLYTYNVKTGDRKALTQGSYEVSEVSLSPDKKFFYFQTNEDHPGKRQLYRMHVDGTAKERITSMEGGYQAFLSPDGTKVAYRFSAQTKPWELYLQDLAPHKKPVQLTDKAMTTEWKAYPWRETKIFTFPARDGKQVYARIYEPAQAVRNRAAVLFVHGAGYLQNVEYAWSYYFREAMFNNLLADLGYTVMDIDYRASAGYGRDWRTAIYRYMGGKDLDDQVDAARWLVAHEGIDSNRVGMYGGSYGGFMSLMALFTQPDVFKAGAALRPVTDWAHYNHEYTEAILNEPFTDSLAYERSSPINFASGLKNHLLICHGMVDVNVHFQDAVRLSQRLIELGKNNWELAVYPVEDHGFVEPSSWTDEYKRVLLLFERNLK